MSNLNPVNIPTVNIQQQPQSNKDFLASLKGTITINIPTKNGKADMYVYRKDTSKNMKKSNQNQENLLEIYALDTGGNPKLAEPRLKSEFFKSTIQINKASNSNSNKFYTMCKRKNTNKGSCNETERSLSNPIRKTISLISRSKILMRDINPLNLYYLTQQVKQFFERIKLQLPSDQEVANFKAEAAQKSQLAQKGQLSGGGDLDFIFFCFITPAGGWFCYALMNILFGLGCALSGGFYCTFFAIMMIVNVLFLIASFVPAKKIGGSKKKSRKNGGGFFSRSSSSNNKKGYFAGLSSIKARMQNNTTTKAEKIGLVGNILKDFKNFKFFEIGDLVENNQNIPKEEEKAIESGNLSKQQYLLTPPAGNYRYYMAVEFSSKFKQTYIKIPYICKIKKEVVDVTINNENKDFSERITVLFKDFSESTIKRVNGLTSSYITQDSSPETDNKVDQEVKDAAAQ